MSLLETNIKQDFSAADGRFFVAPELDKTLPIIDLTNLRHLGKEVLEFAGLISEAKVKPNLLTDIFRTGFAEALVNLQSGLRIETGLLSVITSREPIAPKPRVKALVKDYGRQSDQTTFSIPAQEITAVNVLAFQNVSDDFRPVVDLRIKTSADRPTTFFKSPGEVIEQPSIGGWYRFELGAIALSHVE